MILTYGAVRPSQEDRPFIVPRSYGDFGFSLKNIVSNVGRAIDPTVQGSVLNTAAGKIPGLQTVLTTTGQLNKPPPGSGAAPAAGAPGGTFVAGPGGIQYQPSFTSTYKWPLIGAGSLVALGLVALLIRSARH